jgi:hypothetical protein
MPALNEWRNPALCMDAIGICNETESHGSFTTIRTDRASVLLALCRPLVSSLCWASRRYKRFGDLARSVNPAMVPLHRFTHSICCTAVHSRIL